MIRTDFLENVTTWGELIDFCNTHGCSYCDDLYDDDSRDSEIAEDISEYGYDYSWQGLRDLLDDIPTGYDFYRRDSAFDWVGLDEGDFLGYKDDVLEWGDDRDIWDWESEEESDEESFSIEDNESLFDEPVEDEDFSVEDLINMCNAELVWIQDADVHKIQEDEQEFKRFINTPQVLK